MNAKAPVGPVHGFLRDCCDENLYSWNRETLHGELTRTDGSKLKLPDDLKGKNVIYQFWSVAHPPQPYKVLRPRWRWPTDIDPPDYVTPLPDRNTVVVGVNLDTDPEAAAAFLHAHREYAQWVHTCSGRGWDDPVARAFDVVALPRTVVTDAAGWIYCAGGRAQSHLDETFARLPLPPPARPAPAPAR